MTAKYEIKEVSVTDIKHLQQNFKTNIFRNVWITK